MALINCPNCGKQYSEHAEKCPKCGLSLQEAQKAKEEKILARKSNQWAKKILYAVGIVISIIVVFFLAHHLINAHRVNSTAVRVENTGTNEYAFVNSKGKSIKTLNCKEAKVVYDKIVFVRGLDNKVGYIDFASNVVVPIEYDEVGLYSYAPDESRFYVVKNNKRGFGDFKRKAFVEPQYDEVYMYNNCVMVRNNRKVGIVDYSNDVILEPDYYEEYGVDENITRYQKKGAKPVYVNITEGKLMSPSELNGVFIPATRALKSDFLGTWRIESKPAFGGDYIERIIVTSSKIQTINNKGEKENYNTRSYSTDGVTLCIGFDWNEEGADGYWLRIDDTYERAQGYGEVIYFKDSQ